MQTYKLHTDSEFTNTVVSPGRLFTFYGYSNGVSGTASLRCKDSSGVFSNLLVLEDISSHEFSSVTDNVVTFSGLFPIVGVLTASGNYWSVSDDVTFSGNDTLLNVTRFLMLDNVASFSGTWQAFYASGRRGLDGVANTLTVGTVTAGTTASVEIVGSAPNQIINFVLPLGPAGYGSAIWSPLYYSAVIELNPTGGENQLLILSGDCSLTAPVLSALSPTLLLQINKSEVGHVVTLGGVDFLGSADVGIFLIGWYFDGSATRRLPLQEVL